MSLRVVSGIIQQIRGRWMRQPLIDERMVREYLARNVYNVAVDTIEAVHIQQYFQHFDASDLAVALSVTRKQARRWYKERFLGRMTAISREDRQLIRDSVKTRLGSGQPLDKEFRRHLFHELSQEYQYYTFSVVVQNATQVWRRHLSGCEALGVKLVDYLRESG